MTFGEQLKARRAELRWTLEEMAKKTGLSRSYLCELEHEKRSIGADSLMRISQAVGVPMDVLMNGQPDKRGMASVQLPPSLMTMASEWNIPFRHALTIYWMARSIMDHRIPSKRTDLDKFDWPKFYNAVVEFL